MDADKLSKQARQEYDKLQAKVRELVAKDRVREPRLTDEEKTEISRHEATIRDLKPKIQKLDELINAKEARKKLIDEQLVRMAIDGADDLEIMVSEETQLPHLLRLLSDAYRSAAGELATSEFRIKTIKERARLREITEEVENE